jgi:hypothetical protein
MRWKGGALTELDLYLPHSKPQIVRTDEDTIALVRRLATHYQDGVVAGILNRQGRKLLMVIVSRPTTSPVCGVNGKSRAMSQKQNLPRANF